MDGCNCSLVAKFASSIIANRLLNNQQIILHLMLFTNVHYTPHAICLLIRSKALFSSSTSREWPKYPLITAIMIIMISKVQKEDDDGNQTASQGLQRKPDSLHLIPSINPV